MFTEYASISKILYKKDTPEEIFSRFSDVEHMTFNANAFEKNISGIEKEIKNVDDSIRADYSDTLYGSSSLAFGNAGPNPIIAKLREKTPYTPLVFNFDKLEKFSFNEYCESRAGKRWLRKMEKLKKDIDDGKKVNRERMHITFDV